VVCVFHDLAPPLATSSRRPDVALMIGALFALWMFWIASLLCAFPFDYAVRCFEMPGDRVERVVIRYTAW
jgi:hypothetical protein